MELESAISHSLGGNMTRLTSWTYRFAILAALLVGAGAGLKWK